MKYTYLLLTTLFISSLFLSTYVGLVDGADEDLAQQYAPYFYFEEQETFFPVDVSYHIDNSQLYLIGDDTEIHFFEENLSDYTTNDYYLDNQQGTINDGGIASDYTDSNLGYTVYSHVVSSGSNTIIQYWMFYAFNDGVMNQHEGDWEMVQIVFSNEEPTQVMYSQHHSGQKAAWDQVEKTENHIQVYVSRGSHANYLRSYSGMVGMANDVVGANGKQLKNSDYTLVMLESQSWLDFAGRWGWVGGTDEDAEVTSLLGQSGPFGPKFREDGMMWNTPLGWGSRVMQADNNIFLLEFVLYNFVTLFVLFTVLILCVLLLLIFRRHKKTGLGPRFISMLYVDGLNLKSIGNILCIAGIILAFISLVYPWYTVSTDIAVSGYETQGMADIIRIDGIRGIQIQIPGISGPIPMGSFLVPFSFLIGISMVFLVISSIGISNSRKLGKKYLSRGVRLMVPVLIILTVVASLSMMPFESLVDTGDAAVDISGVLDAISASPSGGQQIVTMPEINEQITLQWGFGIGGLLLLISGLLLVISGGLEFISNTELFAIKPFEGHKKENHKGKQKNLKQQKEEKDKLIESEEKEQRND